MKKINIIVHCYAARLPHYAAALRYQLESLMLNPSANCSLVFTICLEPDDERTCYVVRAFIDRGLAMRYCFLNPPQLGRRAIGRNVMAKATDADIVWFADVDMMFRNGILDRLATMEWPAGAVMIYPREIRISRDHAIGDEVLGREDVSVDLDENLFVPKAYHRAIGGVQIVRGDFAREHGYLNGIEKWMAPRTDGKPFGDFRDDIAYRKFCLKHGTIEPVDLPGIYRLRHGSTTYR